MFSQDEEFRRTITKASRANASNLQFDAANQTVSGGGISQERRRPSVLPRLSPLSPYSAAGICMGLRDHAAVTSAQVWLCQQQVSLEGSEWRGMNVAHKELPLLNRVGETPLPSCNQFGWARPTSGHPGDAAAGPAPERHRSHQVLHKEHYNSLPITICSSGVLRA